MNDDDDDDDVNDEYDHGYSNIKVESKKSLFRSELFDQIPARSGKGTCSPEKAGPSERQVFNLKVLPEGITLNVILQIKQHQPSTISKK